MGPRHHVCLVIYAAALVLAAESVPMTSAADRAPGYKPSVFALEHAKIVTEPGQTIESGTLVLRDGMIQAVGPDDAVEVPYDAERIDGTGLVAYAGLIDALSTAGIDKETKRSVTGEGRKVDYGSFALGATPPDNRRGMTPEFQVAIALTLDDEKAKQRREAGFTAMLVAPDGGVATGQSALVATSGQPRREIIIQSPVALHVALRSTGERSYPATLMGFVAHLRQAMLDAEHYEKTWQHFREHGGKQPAVDPALASIRSAQKGELRVFWEANSVDEIHRALDLAEEFGVTPVIVGGRDAWKVADRLAEAQVPVVLRIDFPEEPKTAAGRGRRSSFLENMSLQQLRDALKRPDIPSRFRSAIEGRLAELEAASKEGSEGQKEKEEQKRKLPESPRVLADLKRKWSERVACASVLAEKGVTFCLSAEEHKKPADFAKHLHLAIEKGFEPQRALAALTTDAAAILGVSERLGRLTEGHAAHVVVYDGAFNESKSKLRYLFVDAERFELNKPSADKLAKADKTAEEKADSPESKAAASDPSEEKPAEKKQEPVVKATAQPAETTEKTAAAGPQKEPYPTEVEADRKPSTQTGGNVVIRDATVLRVTQDTLQRATIVVRDGKITAVGADIDVPQGVQVIEAEGLYVMPGIIDTHSHIAISGGINEATLAVVPEVRITDVVNSEDASIYRALAGGVTAARLLHGSANPIGGQDAVVKLRWGKTAREMLIGEGPRGVKFALGENPKRSSTRYPDTRLGVESVIRRAFEEGRMYRRVWELYATARSRGENVAEPRRDLRLDALADIVDGRMLIHSHCYRADEILMLLRLAETFGVRVQSLQHVLEGYKVAAEIAAHGASNSTFSDWWAYKIEAFDAIPYNTALLIEAGAKVAIKSDDGELMRHLYQEAAKMLKYGRLSERQALATITINAAEQLGLEHRIGSIEVGKDADLAIFTGHPLNGFARCEMTLIDGEFYFERKGNREPSGHGLPLPPEPLRDLKLTIDPSPSNRYALLNARIVPVVGDVIERGTLLVEDGQIKAIAGANMPVPEGAVSVDLAGLSVYPGMINAGGALGLSEIGSVNETHDYRERGEYNADVRASIALHPESELIPVSRANGILSTLTEPSGGVISGQSVILNLAGWIPPEMAVVDPAALHVNLPTGSYGTSAQQRKRADEQIEKLKERFRLARSYDQIRTAAEQNGDLGPAPDPKLEALAPYAKGERRVIIQADRHGEILSAIKLAEELELDWILSGAADAWKCVEELKKHNVRVILGPSMTTPSGAGAPYDASYRTAAMLHEAGVKFAMKAVSSGPGRATSTRNLPYQAAMAVSYGLPPEEGLKAVTLYPAQLLGVADRLGSIEVGKMANLVISDGNLLQPATEIKALFIAGKPIEPASRHTRLYARYQKRLREVQEGKALLGVQQPSAAGEAANTSGRSE